ncbi:MAG: hypothetical protein J6S75_01950 [Thermoguttaceae bacterium]|nr:hypothetical protein [Thermoguttaceae bacterium]
MLKQFFDRFKRAEAELRFAVEMSIMVLIDRLKRQAEGVDPNSNIRIVRLRDIQSRSWDPRYLVPSAQAMAVLDDLNRGSSSEAKVSRLREMVSNCSVRYPNGDRVTLNPTTIGLIKSSEIGQLIDCLGDK